METKTRVKVLYAAQPYQQSYQQNWDVDSSDGVITKGVSLPVTSLETTQSSGHPWYKSKGASTDIGGDFTTSKVTSIVNHSPGTFYGVKRFGQRYIGPAWAANPYDGIRHAEALVLPSQDSYLMEKGTTAIANCIPTNPVADAATFLGELKGDGIPKLIGRDLLKTKFKDYRKYGSEYLGYQFGWLPIVSDLQKFAQATIESEKILNQLERDSGKNVHRKFAFPEDVSTGDSVTGQQYCYLPNGLVLSTNQYDGAGTLTVNTEVKVKTWFSGCFTYHVNLGNTLPDRIARSAAEARKLYGIELTPETVWNLAPWSWAADWGSNIGDVLHNVSRFSQDGLVMRYGYIMQQKTAKVTYTLSRGGVLTGLSNADLSFTVTSQSKVRRKATPFGFGISMNGLSGRQLSILGALGIARGPRG